MITIEILFSIFFYHVQHHNGEKYINSKTINYGLHMISQVHFWGYPIAVYSSLYSGCFGVVTLTLFDDDKRLCLISNSRF